MASTYVNNLRLEEIGTGEQSGTWGDTTNTNLEIIGQAVAWGTRAIANASSDNITIADGALDADRCLGLKLTGGGQACTVTLLPNTSSKTWFMYNATAAALTFTCGSGANVIIPAGQTKVIATDGLGSGGVVHDLLTAVNLAGITTVDDLAVTDDLVVGDDASVGGILGVTGVLTTTAATVFNGGFASNGNSTVDGTLSTATGLVHLGDSNTSIDFGTDTQSYYTGGVRSLDFSTSGAVFNEDGANLDFRVESEDLPNMFFVDGGNNSVQVGSATPNLKFWHGTTLGPKFMVEQVATPEAGNYVTIAAVRHDNSSEPPQFGFAKSRGTAAGAVTALQASDGLGLISFQGADGTNYIEGARISANVESGVGGNDMPADLRFFTNRGSTGVTESMRITAAGNVVVKTGGANLKLPYDSSTNNSANFSWSMLQLGNNGANRIVAGNTQTGGDFEFIVNNTVDLSSSNSANHNGTTAMVIDSSANVGMGTATFIDGSRFQFAGAKTAQSNLIPRGQLSITDTTAVAAGVGGSINFVGNYSGSSKTTYGSVEGFKLTASGGNYGGALVLRSRTHGGNNEERIRLDPDGLKFHGDTAAANALNDYEEGVGTAGVTGNSGGTATTTGFLAYYTKIGRVVHYQFECRVTNISGVSGALRVALPFSATDYSAGALRCYDATFDGSPFLETSAGSAYGNFQCSKTGANTQPILSTGYYYGSVSYVA